MRLAPLNRFKPSIKIFYWPFQGRTSFVDLLCFCSVLCLLCLCARLSICASWSADLLALVYGVYCEFATFRLVSWVRCGTWLYRFLIFALLLTFITWTPLDGFHIWHNDCLWGVDYNIGFLSPLCHWCQKTRSHILTISLWLVMRTPPSFFDQWYSYLAQLLLSVCDYKVRYISPIWPWSERLIRICLTVVCFWQRCFIFVE